MAGGGGKRGGEWDQGRQSWGTDSHRPREKAPGNGQEQGMPPGAECPVGSKKAEQVPPACFRSVLRGPARTKSRPEWGLCPMGGRELCGARQCSGWGRHLLREEVCVCSSSLRPSCWRREYRPPGHPCRPVCGPPGGDRSQGREHGGPILLVPSIWQLAECLEAGRAGSGGLGLVPGGQVGGK